MGVGERRGGVGCRARVGEDRLERALGDEHHRGIKDVLGRRPGVGLLKALGERDDR